MTKTANAKPCSVKPCPICGKPPDAKAFPFCSPRCADVDLNRWLAGAYVVPGDDNGDGDDGPPGPSEDRNGSP